MNIREKDVIQFLQQRFQNLNNDCAYVNFEESSYWNWTTDMLMDGIHFQLKQHKPSAIARKALAVNLSDLAASASLPRFALLSVALPRQFDQSELEQLIDGFDTLSNAYDVQLIGGDTNIWAGPLVINIAVAGVAHPKGPIGRNGAQPGDILFVTGPLGGSLVRDRHLYFEPQIAKARYLADQFNIKAMTDISDGLAEDARQIAHHSRCQLVVNVNQVPIHNDVSSKLSIDQRIKHALTDGEDFELLFVVGPKDAKRLRADSTVLGVYEIGYCQQGEGFFIINTNNQIIKCPYHGYEHS